MYLHSIASAFPEHSYTQAECWEVVCDSSLELLLRPRSIGILQKVLTGDSGIEKRHFCLPDPKEVFLKDAGALNRDFERFAPEISSQALEKAMEKGGYQATDLDALFVCTCTGYLCPGISSHLAEKLGLRPDAYLQDIVGLGCGAAIPTLRSAANLIGAHPDATVAVVAVEICSAAFFIDDNPGVLISLCLFGDGASASIWGGAAPKEGPAYRASKFNTVHIPEEREKIRFVNEEGKLRNKLHRSVPALAAEAVSSLYEAGGHNGAIGRIIAHPGGRDVIEALEAKLPFDELAESREVLRNYGNLSSPSVLVALETHLGSESPDANLWLTSFGAGFSCHSLEMTRS